MCLPPRRHSLLSPVARTTPPGLCIIMPVDCMPQLLIPVVPLQRIPLAEESGVLHRKGIALLFIAMATDERIMWGERPSTFIRGYLCGIVHRIEADLEIVSSIYFR